MSLSVVTWCPVLPSHNQITQVSERSVAIRKATEYQEMSVYTNGKIVVVKQGAEGVCSVVGSSSGGSRRLRARKGEITVSQDFTLLSEVRTLSMLAKLIHSSLSTSVNAQNSF